MPGTLNDFQISLMKTTLLKPFYLRTAIDDYRGRILSNFEQLGHVPERPEPTFAFAHFIMPHPPYVFGPNGESTDYDYTLAGNRIWAQTDGYRDQVIFANQRVLALVDQILAGSEPPPIILLQGDHGTASTGGWAGPTEAFLRERTAILNAFYLPDGGIDRLYPTITPVNTFRVVFDTYFGQQLDLLEDRTFFSSDKLPYQFDEIIVGG